MKKTLLLTFIFIFSIGLVSAADGYTTEVDIYLDIAAHNGGTFDWSSAVNGYATDDSCTHRRDFIISCGWYDDTSAGDGFVCSASNNAPGWPKDPNRNPTEILATGWYTFKHTFRDDGAGVLAVDMEILDQSDNVIASWTLSDPTDVIGVTVGGNRYGWFPTNTIGTLPIDNSKKCDYSGCSFEQGFETNIDGWFTPTQVASGTNGVTSLEGSFHAEMSGNDYTRWGGYSCEWPVQPAQSIVITSGAPGVLNAGGVVAEGAGVSPVVEYIWVLPDDDDVTSDTQLEIVPSGERNDIYACLVVSDENGKETIRDVFVDVYHPDASKKYQVHATEVTDPAEIELCKTNARDAGLISTEEFEEINYWIFSQPRWKMYKVFLPMYYHQPSGIYEARGYATDSTNRLSAPTSDNFDWVAGTYLELDFSSIDFGTLQPGFWQYIDGDLDMATADAPTLKNEGNTEIQVGVEFSDFVGAAFDKRITRFDAQLRSMADNYGDIAGEHVEMDGGERVDFMYPISLCRQEKLDLSIHADDGLVPDTYSGSLTIYATPVLVDAPVPDMTYPVPPTNDPV